MNAFIRRAAAAARRHWLITSVVVIGVLLRVAVQIAYWPALLYIDSVRYLYAESNWDPLGYLAVLWPLLHVGGLALVSGAQHLLGLGMGVAIYAVAVRRGAQRWVGALAATPVLFDAYQLQLEQNVMADALFEAAIVAGLAVLLWRPRPRLRAIALAGLAFGTAGIIREVGLVLIVPGVVYVWLAMRGTEGKGRGLRRYPIKYPALLCLSFGLPVAGYLLVIFAATGHAEFDGQGSDLYGRAAAAANCATLRVPGYETALCPSRSTAKALGVDGLIHSPGSPAVIYVAPPGMTTNEVRGDFTREVFLQQPFAVARALGSDILGSFSYPRTDRQADTPISRWQFQTRYPAFPPYLPAAREADIMRQFGGGTPGVVVPVAAALRAYQLDGGYTPGPLLALACLIGMAGAAGAGCIWDRLAGRSSVRLTERLQNRRRERLWGLKRHADERSAPGPPPAELRAACFLVTASAILLLLGADVVEFSWRYQLPGLVTLPLAGALGRTALTNRRRPLGAGTASQRSAEPAARARAGPAPRATAEPAAQSTSEPAARATGESAARATPEPAVRATPGTGGSAAGHSPKPRPIISFMISVVPPKIV